MIFLRTSEKTGEPANITVTQSELKRRDKHENVVKEPALQLNFICPVALYTNYVKIIWVRNVTFPAPPVPRHHPIDAACDLYDLCHILVVIDDTNSN